MMRVSGAAPVRLPLGLGDAAPADPGYLPTGEREQTKFAAAERPYIEPSPHILSPTTADTRTVGGLE